MSAGIVCIMVDPDCRGIYFLLGKNKYVDSWSDGSLKWGEFGGIGHPFETCVFRVAAREWLEETLACVKVHAWDNIPHTNAVGFTKALRDMQFLFRVDCGSKTLFVQQIPWDPTVVTRFALTRRALLHVQNDKVLSHSERQLLRHHPALSVIGRRRLFHDQRHKQMRWRYRIDHPIVSPEFLEKQEIGLWSLPQIKHAVENRGILCTSRGEQQLKSECIASFALIVKQLQILAPHLSH